MPSAMPGYAWPAGVWRGCGSQWPRRLTHACCHGGGGWALATAAWVAQCAGVTVLLGPAASPVALNYRFGDRVAALKAKAAGWLPEPSEDAQRAALYHSITRLEHVDESVAVRYGMRGHAGSGGSDEVTWLTSKRHVLWIRADLGVGGR